MDIAKDAKTLSIIDEKVQLIKLSVGLAVVTIILFILPFPVFIPLLFVVLGATFLGLSFMKLERLKNLNTKIPKEPTKQTPTIDVQIHPDEKILAATYGIISKQTTGTSYRPWKIIPSRKYHDDFKRPYSDCTCSFGRRRCNC